MTIEFAAELMMLSTYSHQTVSSPPHASTASVSVDAKVTDAAMSATRRRSNASASMPPYSPATIMGSRPATAIIATANVDPVRSNMCSMTATTVSCPPRPARVEPTHMRVKAELSRNGRRSMNESLRRRAIIGCGGGSERASRGRGCTALEEPNGW